MPDVLRQRPRADARTDGRASDAALVAAVLRQIDHRSGLIDTRLARLGSAALSASRSRADADRLRLREARAIQRELRQLKASLALTQTYLHERARQTSPSKQR
jgi:hypothetical protein